MKYKLEYTLYDDDGYLTTDKDDYCELFAKKGEIFQLLELTDELREEYDVYDEMWQYIFIKKKSSKYILSQDGDTSNFVEVEE